jgi:hypothetical protein
MREVDPQNDQTRKKKEPSPIFSKGKGLRKRPLYVE